MQSKMILGIAIPALETQIQWFSVQMQPQAK